MASSSGSNFSNSKNFLSSFDYCVCVWHWHRRKSINQTIIIENPPLTPIRKWNSTTVTDAFVAPSHSLILFSFIDIHHNHVVGLPATVCIYTCNKFPIYWYGKKLYKNREIFHLALYRDDLFSRSYVGKMFLFLFNVHCRLSLQFSLSNFHALRYLLLWWYFVCWQNKTLLLFSHPSYPTPHWLLVFSLLPRALWINLNFHKKNRKNSHFI